MEVVPKHQLATVPMTSCMGCLSLSCYDDFIFNYYFIAFSIGKTSSVSLMKLNNLIFYYCFISLLTLSKLKHTQVFIFGKWSQEKDRNISRNELQILRFYLLLKMLLLVILFAILKIVLSSCIFVLKSWHGRALYTRYTGIWKKDTTLNTKGLKRGTKGINMKMT